MLLLSARVNTVPVSWHAVFKSLSAEEVKVGDIRVTIRVLLVIDGGNGGNGKY